MTLGESKDFEFLKEFREAIADEGNRGKMLNGTRGIGYWIPKTKEHVIMMWYLFPQGYVYANLNKLGGRSKILYRGADAVVAVPSFDSIDMKTGRVGEYYDIVIYSMPINEEFKNQELLHTKWDGARCFDAIHRKTRSRIQQFPTTLPAHKYTNPEQPICKHIFTAEFKLKKFPQPGRPLFQGFRFPVPRVELSKILRTLKTGTLIGSPKDGKRRKPSMAEISSYMGMAISISEPEDMLIFENLKRYL